MPRGGGGGRGFSFDSTIHRRIACSLRRLVRLWELLVNEKVRVQLGPAVVQRRLPQSIGASSLLPRIFDANAVNVFYGHIGRETPIRLSETGAKQGSPSAVRCVTFCCRHLVQNLRQNSTACPMAQRFLTLVSGPMAACATQEPFFSGVVVVPSRRS